MDQLTFLLKVSNQNVYLVKERSYTLMLAPHDVKINFLVDGIDKDHENNNTFFNQLARSYFKLKLFLRDIVFKNHCYTREKTENPLIKNNLKL